MEFISIQDDATKSGKHRDLGYSKFVDDAGLLCDVRPVLSTKVTLLNRLKGNQYIHLV